MKTRPLGLLAKNKSFFSILRKSELQYHSIFPFIVNRIKIVDVSYSL